MKTYLKEYGYYANNFDCGTIAQIKTLEDVLLDKIPYEDFPSKSDSVYQTFLALAIKRSLEKKDYIKEIMDTHKRMDALVQSTPIPVLNCKKCRQQMDVIDYEFKKDATEIRFIYRCPNGHYPLKKLRPDGSSLKVKMVKCERCGGRAEAHEAKKEDTIKYIDTCIDCGFQHILEIELDKLNDADFARYCKYFEAGLSLLDSNSREYPVLLKIIERGERTY